MIQTRTIRGRVRIAVLILGILSTGSAGVAGDDPLFAKSRGITATFAEKLQAALKEAMASGGPVAAIDVCKDLAPAIASELSRESGAKVSRTSLRFRNPGNAPEPWQTEVLRMFNDSDTTKEFFERTKHNETRYMKAIPTGSLCLTCHGSELPKAIQDQLAQDYPHDRASGYQLGEIRGAFSITWPDPVNKTRQ